MHPRAIAVAFAAAALGVGVGSDTLRAQGVRAVAVGSEMTASGPAVGSEMTAPKGALGGELTARGRELGSEMTLPRRALGSDPVVPRSAAGSDTGPPGPPPRTRAVLDAYVRDALRENLALAALGSAQSRADAAIREAQGRFLPSAGVNARYSEFSGVVNIGDFINPAYRTLNQLIGQDRFPTNISSTLPVRQETRLEVVQPLYNDALFGAAAAARAARDLAGATRHTAMRQLAADVQLAWVAYASATRLVETLDAMTPVLAEGLRASERLVGVGQATPDAVLRARSEQSDLQQQLADARERRRAAQRGFNLLRNAAGDAPIEIPNDSLLLDEIATTDTLTLATLTQWAAAHREELAQADGGIRLATAQQRIAGAAFRPSVGVSLSYGVQGDRYQFDAQHDVALASVVLTWNVFNGGQDRARREQASLMRDEATLRRQDAERGVATQVANAFDAFTASRTAVNSATDRFTSAARAFALVERRYAEGLATPVEYLSARAAFTGAAINRVISRYTVFARFIELERAAALRSLPN